MEFTSERADSETRRLSPPALSNWLTPSLNMTSGSPESANFTRSCNRLNQLLAHFQYRFGLAGCRRSVWRLLAGRRTDQAGLTLRCVCHVSLESCCNLTLRLPRTLKWTRNNNFLLATGTYLCLRLFSLVSLFRRKKHIFKNIMKQGILRSEADICPETWTQSQILYWWLLVLLA